MQPEWLEQLNSAQRDAVTHGEGPLLVIAGAGTGKTRTLASRVAYLLHQGVSPDKILLLAFTRRAAAQMISQIRDILESSDATTVWHGTFHAVANRLLRIYGNAVGLGEGFTVMDQGDAADLLGIIRGELGYAKTSKRFPQKVTLCKMYSHTINAQTPLTDVMKKHFPWCMDEQEAISQIFKAYVQRKRENNVMDYDDLLLFWRLLVHDSPVADLIADRFDHVLVDEYQDTNLLQSDIISGMRARKRNLVAVGDDAQAIYSFRAATIRNILDFPTIFDGARVVTLEKNYRSTQTILAASNAVMEQAKERYTKNLFSDKASNQKPILHTCRDDEEQTTAICTRVLEQYESGVALKNQAVLFRSSHHSARLEVELKRRNIPFHKFGGLKFVEAAHIKDTLAYLRVLENPSDRLSWYRVLGLIPGVGLKTAQRMITHLLQQTGDNQTIDAGAVTHSVFSRLKQHPPKAPVQGKEFFDGLVTLMSACNGLDKNGSAAAEADDQGSLPDLPTQVELVRRYYEPLCDTNYENAKMRIRDLEQLANIAAGYRSREKFITDLTLDPPVSTSDLAGPPMLDDDYLTLSTIHSAKGCEWHSVHVIHASDGHIPSDMATSDQDGIDEERRLFYVALTRAKEWLYVYFPLRYYHSGNPRSDKHSYAQLTRFVDDNVKPLFEKRFSERDEILDVSSADAKETVNKWLDSLFDH
ncbi:MAG: ATP-dependent helicase [Phycisphaerae bacterium]